MYNDRSSKDPEILTFRGIVNEDANNLGLQFKFNLKTLILIIVILVGIYFLIPKLIGIPEIIRLIIHVNKVYLLLGLVFEFLSYVGAALLLGIILSRLGHKIKFWDRFKISSIAAFAIHFFPVGSLGEGAIDYYFLRRKKVDTGSILLMLILRIIFTYSAFLLIFLIGLALVPTAPSLEISPKIISFIIFALIFGGVWYLIYLYRNKDKFYRLWKHFSKFFDKYAAKISGIDKEKDGSREVFEDIYQGIGLFGQKKRSSVYGLLAALFYWLGDITCFYFVFLSFGYHIHIGVLIFSYGIASIISMISFIPGGIGVTEGSLGLLYSGLGVPSALAVTAILVFRLFSFWIWIPFGLYSFVSLSRSKK